MASPQLLPTDSTTIENSQSLPLAVNTDDTLPNSPILSPTVNTDDTLPNPSTTSIKSASDISINLALCEQIWNGCVPVLFDMASNEIISNIMNGIQDPVSIFLLLPRISYLPLVTEKVHNHFATYAPALSDGMWFEFNGNPLKWNFPIGVLYDLYIHEQYKNPNNNDNNDGKIDQNDDPVWKIIVHFQSYPSEDVIMRCDNINAVKILFFNYLKQSLFLAYNNINAIASLKKDDQNALWNGVCTADYNLYFPIYQSLFGRISNKHSKMMRYPFRIILRGFDEGDNTQKKIDLIPIQRPIKVNNDENDTDGNIITLEKCLKHIIPGVMQMYYNQNNNKQIDIIIQGMKIPLNVPMMWLIRHATSADCFLYIVIVNHLKTRRCMQQ